MEEVVEPVVVLSRFSPEAEEAVDLAPPCRCGWALPCIFARISSHLARVTALFGDTGGRSASGICGGLGVTAALGGAPPRWPVAWRVGIHPPLYVSIELNLGSSRLLLLSSGVSVGFHSDSSCCGGS